ncbi:MAG: winged helix-turn-helix domain-containing protein [Candidatus Aenigmatarchaeota archaeon]
MSIDKRYVGIMTGSDESVEVDRDLLKIRNQVRSPVKTRSHDDEIDQIASQLESLGEKVDEIRENISDGGNTHTKLKKKKEIIYLLKKEKRITTSELSEKLELSRTRCSEYLNEMKKEGVLTSKKDGRTKYYELDI